MVIRKAGIWVVALALLVLAAASPARAEEPLTQQLTRWLDEPGVRVVAVEVYSDYCEPCKAAAPRWERLRQRYADRGLKLVVINVDPYESDAQCKSLPWRPDLLKCAPGLAAQLGVCQAGRCSVPQAFVWSWQGNLLVQGKTHIAEVERALAEYFDTKNPRVLVEAVGSKAAANRKVRRLIEAALATHDKLTVVADGAEQARLRRLRKESHALNRRQDQQCEPGQELSANMRLVAEDFGDTMSLSLQDIASGACGTTVTADWKSTKAAKSANRGIYQLLGRLRRRPPQMPSRATARPPLAAVTPMFGGGQVTASLGRMRVEGKPRGARVEVSGPGGMARVVALPATLEGLEPGTYALAVSAGGRLGRKMSARVRPDETAIVRVVLDSPGGIEVNGEPGGALVEVFDPAGGKLVAKSFPVKGGGLTPGTYRVRVTREGYEEYDQPHPVQAGRTTSVSVTLRRAAVGTIGERVGIKWVRLPGGSFRMGSTTGRPDEKPVRTVRIASFELAKTEVTVAQYRACVEAGRCTTEGVTKYPACNWGEAERDDHPMNCLDWYQASAFSKWVGGRLPSEAEWEYAARSAGRDITYPWGDGEPTCARTVMEKGGSGCGEYRTWSVCGKQAGNSDQGLCDLAGNVWEWVEDCYGDYDDAPSDGHAVTGCSAGAYRVRRGGGWFGGAGRLRATYRSGLHPPDRLNRLGFRPARSVP